jgi:hypothetical protein
VGPALTLHFAVPSDTDAIDGLAQLDSARAPRGVVPVAEVGGELWAAIRLDDHHVSPTRSSPPASSWRGWSSARSSLRRVQRGRNHLLPRVWPGTGYDRPAIG